MKITDSIIWLTGASSGLGEAMAYLLCKKGARLILSSRREKELERVKSSCEGPHAAEIKILPLDLAKADELPEKAALAEAFFGRIDILINNGGISQRAKVIDTDMSVYRKIMEVDFFGQIHLSKLVLPGMVKRKCGRHVIITSATGIISTPYRSAYAAAKHALHGFYDALHAEEYENNVRVTIIAPGFIHTNVSYNALTGKGEPQKIHDKAIVKGMAPEKAAGKIVSAIEKDKEELFFGGAKELTAVYVKRFFPALFARMVRKMEVK